MFKKTNPQLKLFGVHTSVGDSLHKRLSDSWASGFRTEVVPILMRSEDKFSILYGAKGRPNVSHRGRIALFQDTIDLFLKKSRDSEYQQVPEPIRQWHEAEPDGWFGLGENEKKARLQQLAQYTHTLMELRIGVAYRKYKTRRDRYYV